MIQTVEATLETDGTIRLLEPILDDQPIIPPQLRGADPDERKRRMLEALESLAKSGAFSEITDPVAWQREIRKDRPLPGRED